MKLIRCEECGDPVALSVKWRDCHCGLSGGAYHGDGHRAVVSGPCRVYGISNRLFFLGERSEAWAYDESNGRVDRLKDNPHSMEAALMRTVA